MSVVVNLNVVQCCIEAQHTCYTSCRTLYGITNWHQDTVCGVKRYNGIGCLCRTAKTGCVCTGINKEYIGHCVATDSKVDICSSAIDSYNAICASDIVAADCYIASLCCACDVAVASQDVTTIDCEQVCGIVVCEVGIGTQYVAVSIELNFSVATSCINVA